MKMPWVPIIIIAILLSIGTTVFMLTLTFTQQKSQIKKLQTQLEATAAASNNNEKPAPATANPTTESTIINTSNPTWKEITIENLWNMKIPHNWEINSQQMTAGIISISGSWDSRQYIIYLIRPTFNPQPPQSLGEWVESDTAEIPDEYKEKLIINQVTVDGRETIEVSNIPKMIKNEEGAVEYSDQPTITTYIWIKEPQDVPIKVVIEELGNNFEESQARKVLDDFLSRVRYLITKKDSNEE